ncbi:MAG: histidine kinase [Chitinophagaceae bacterium]|nr:histidine kinase [Chitinophagaceae bacterium]
MQHAQAKNYLLRSFTNNNGLPSASAGYLYQDSSGFFWQCCFGGIVRFDGTSFKTFDNSNGLANYEVKHIFEERKNQFWVCNAFNLFSFDGNTFKPQHTNLNKAITFDKLVKLPNRQIWLQTNEGCFLKKNDSTFVRFVIGSISSEKITDFHVLKNHGILIFSHGERKIYLLNTTKPQTINLEPSELVTGFYNIDSTCYIATNKRFINFLPSKNTISLPSTFNAANRLTSIFKDPLNHIWFTDSSYHLWFTDGKSVSSFAKKYDIPKLDYPQYIIDRNGNIVIGHIHGMLVFRESLYEEITDPDFSKPDALTYTTSMWNTDTLCMGIRRNSFQLLTDNQYFTYAVDTKDILPDNVRRNTRIFNTKTPNRKVIYISRKGPFYLQNNSLIPFTTAKIPFEKGFIGCAYNKETDQFYCGRKGLIYRISKNDVDSFSLENIEKSLIPHNYQILPDGNVYFQATHKYWFRLRNDSLEMVTDLLHLNKKDATIFLHNNSLWVLLHGIELREYSISTNGFSLQRTITKSNGLLDANANDIVFDELNNLWINAFSGLYFLKLSKQGSNSNYYSKKIPLQLNEDNSPIIDHISYSNNRLYAFARGGLLVIHTNNALFETKPIQTYFKQIHFNGSKLEDLLRSKKAVLTGNGYELSYQNNTATFELATIYYGFDDAIQYQYQLLGHSLAWKNLLNGNAITYNNLSNGNYTLVVRSVNQLNNSSYSETAFRFRIEPPFYKTWWFSLFAALGTAGLIIFMIRQRDLRKTKENKIAIQLSELKLEALQSQMNPHFIFNALNSIQNYILQNNQIDAARYLSKFSKLIRKTLDNSHHQVIPLEEIIAALGMYLELEAFRFNHEFSYEIKLDDSNDQIFHLELPPMLFQPFVENSIIHGLMPKDGEKKLLIHIYIKQHNLYCIIDDNGVGRKNNTRTDGHISRGQKLIEGMLESMRQLRMTAPSIHINDKINQQGVSEGTTVEIIIPLEN